MSEVFAMTAIQLIQEIREKRLGIEEITGAYLKRIEKYDGMPRGMILYGADEMRLFEAALTLEKYCALVLMPNL